MTSHRRCPCCGYLTLLETQAYEVCPVCYWEDDPSQRQDPTLEDGANPVSLERAREHFRATGASTPRYLSEVRDPKNHEIPESRRRSQ